MRKILLVLVASFIQSAVAADLPKEMYMANDAGGFVVLTLETCAFEKVAKDYPYKAYATESSDLAKHEGCWDSPDVSGVPTQLLSSSEGAPAAPTMRVIPMVNTWWAEGGQATFMQSHFGPAKNRIEMTSKPIVVKP